MMLIWGDLGWAGIDLRVSWDWVEVPTRIILSGRVAICKPVPGMLAAFRRTCRQRRVIEWDKGAKRPIEKTAFSRRCSRNTREKRGTISPCRVMIIGRRRNNEIRTGDGASWCGVGFASLETKEKAAVYKKSFLKSFLTSNPFWNPYIKILFNPFWPSCLLSFFLFSICSTLPHIYIHLQRVRLCLYPPVLLRFSCPAELLHIIYTLSRFISLCLFFLCSVSAYIYFRSTPAFIPVLISVLCSRINQL